MRRVAWRVAGAAALCAAAVAAEEEDGSGSGSGSADAHRVLTLEDDTFEAAIQAEVLLVEFYAPWCGHCKEIAPAYDLAAQQLGKIHGKQLLAKMDATNSASAVVKYKVHSYPTILLFSEGENVDELSGARSATDITAYMSKFARGPEEMIALKDSIARTKAAEAGTGHLVLATPDMYNDFLLDHAEGTVVTFFHAKFCQRPAGEPVPRIDPPQTAALQMGVQARHIRTALDNARLLKRVLGAPAFGPGERHPVALVVVARAVEAAAEVVAQRPLVLELVHCELV